VADDGSANLATALPRGPGPEAEAARPGGLGLRLVRALVDEELGGQFTLAIRPGKGSLATATIPGKA